MMHIPVLNQLETRTDWVSFFRRERSYAYIRHPLCLIDLQSTYLQITLLNEEHLDGRQAVKYSLGSRSSVEPAWRLIKSCNWQLSTLIEGLETLRFDSNVRDNSFLQRHTDLTVRKFFAKEKHIIAPTLVAQINPLTSLPDKWDIPAAQRLLSFQQFNNAIYLPSPAQTAPIKQVLLKMLDSSVGWSIKPESSAEGTLVVTISYQNKAILQLTPDIKKPVPRLKVTG